MIFTYIMLGESKSGSWYDIKLFFSFLRNLGHMQSKFWARIELESSVKIAQVAKIVVERQSTIHDLRIRDLSPHIWGRVFSFGLFSCFFSASIDQYYHRQDVQVFAHVFHQEYLHLMPFYFPNCRWIKHWWVQIESISIHHW